MSRTMLIVSASAGTGKTYDLTHRLHEILSLPDAPDAETVVATTFTRKAAADLSERARRVLLEKGLADQANRLEGAFIGTVNSVCGQILERYAFEAGVSPRLRVVDETEEPLVFAEAISGAMDVGTLQELGRLCETLGTSLDDVKTAARKIVREARANRMSAESLARCADLSVEGLLALWPAPSAGDGEAFDARLRAELEAVEAALAGNGDTTKDTAAYRKLVSESQSLLKQGRPLPWEKWVKLSGDAPGAKSKTVVAGLKEAAVAHREHPRLREELARWTRGVFAVARGSMDLYQRYKEERGLIDFVDQEARVLELVERKDLAERLAEDVHLLLVDEFQDTSPIQLAMFLALSRVARKSIWVGDPKQSIYAFRGADPALMQATIRRLGGEQKQLDRNYRSRPLLVDLTSELFAGAFGGEFSRDEVRTSATRGEDATAPPPLAWWRLTSKNLDEDAACIAAGVASLLEPPEAERMRIVEPWTNRVRPLRPGDIAVLCRRNDEGCAKTAAALERLGIRAAISQTGLVATPEGGLVFAALRRLLDRRDTLATAEIVAMTAADPSPELWLADRIRHLQAGGVSQEWAEGHPVIRSLEGLQGELAVLSPSEVLDRVIDLADLRRLVLGWGRAGVRLGNLESMRRYARVYEDHCRNQRGAATVAGLVEWSRELAAAGGDEQSEGIGEDAVHVLTCHRSKGLEWPVVVLAELDYVREADPWGLRVMDDREEVDLEAPLAGRWLRYWTNPYGRNLGKSGIQTATAYLEATRRVADRETSELKRLLYVGMTRARDVLVLAVRSKEGNDKHAWMDKVFGDEPSLEVSAGEGRVQATVRGTEMALPAEARTFGPREEALQAARESLAWPARPSVLPQHPPARVSASGDVLIEGLHATIGEVLDVGPRLMISGKPEMDVLGSAIHGFLGADDPSLARDVRRTLATDLMRRFGVEAAVDAEALVTRSDALREALSKKYKVLSWRTEWPLQVRLGAQVISGWADLVVETPDGWVLVDHKSFPGPREKWEAEALSHAPQLAAYSLALERATGRAVVACFIHFVVGGGLAQVRPQVPGVDPSGPAATHCGQTP